MTRPKLYPSHQHQWARSSALDMSHLVTCTVCGFTAPRTLAGLDGRITEVEWEAAKAQGRETARQLGIPVVRVADDGTIHDVPEQETL